MRVGKGSGSLAWPILPLGSSCAGGSSSSTATGQICNTYPLKSAQRSLFPHSCVGIQSLYFCSEAFSPPDLQISQERLEEFLRAEVGFFASLQPKSITLKQILDVSTPEAAAKLTFAELPIRFAQRIEQIEGLQGWMHSPELNEVHSLYSQNFRDIRLIELDVNNLAPFTEVVERIKGRMRTMIPKLATAMRNLQQTEGFSEASLVQWLDTFFLSRIGTEMLTSQYLACVSPDPNVKRRSRVGVFDFACDPASICLQAARHAQKLCQEHFGGETDVQIRVESTNKSDFELESRIRFPYVPNYLFYIMVELLKNSARATVEAHRADATQKPRPIVITVGADPSQVAIRVEDEAGGIPFSASDRVWSYMYSTATKGGTAAFSQQGTPLAGYGVGLPLSRLYARYLGGSLQLQSLPGVGTCAYLYLKRLETEAREELPNRSSVGSISLI